MKNETVNNLLEMETIENNLAYGLLKVDTQKERIYIDDENKEVHYSFFEGMDEKEWYTKTYEYEEWNEKMI